MFKYGVVSGHLNPIHHGHCQYVKAASWLCDRLIFIVNNDIQVRLKGNVPILGEAARVEVAESIRWINEVVLSIDIDSSVCETLRLIHSRSGDNQITFFNSGDRNPDNQNSSESLVCQELGIGQVFLDLPKVESSTNMRSRARS